MGHFLHYAVLGAFWEHRSDPKNDFRVFLEELRSASGNEDMRKCVTHGPGYGDDHFFSVLPLPGKSGRTMDKAYHSTVAYLEHHCAPGEKWANVQWVEVMMYSEFTDNAPLITRGRGWRKDPSA